MNANIIVVILSALVCSIGAPPAANQFDTAKADCLTQYKSDSATVEYFFAHGVFPAGKEDMKCYFECVGKKMNAIDSSGKLNSSHMLKWIKDNKSRKDIAIFDEQAIEECTDEKSTGTTCEKLYTFTKCAVDLKLKKP